jgi:hypothetical protein
MDTPLKKGNVTGTALLRFSAYAQWRKLVFQAPKKVENALEMHGNSQRQRRHSQSPRTLTHARSVGKHMKLNALIGCAIVHLLCFAGSAQLACAQNVAPTAPASLRDALTLEATASTEVLPDLAVVSLTLSVNGTVTMSQ